MRVYESLAINSGLYNFTLNNEVLVKARFTFVYRRINESSELITNTIPTNTMAKFLIPAVEIPISW